MDLRQLRYLVALGEERSFTRAAQREHIAQPSLSQQIRRLEDEVGLPLVERTTRSLRITDAGRLLLSRARRILAELEAAEAELQSLRGVQAGNVSVGAMHSMGPVDLSLALALFHDRYPHVGLSVREQSSEELADMLRGDVLDVAFLSVTERIQSEGLGLQRLIEEELVVMVPGDHHLASRQAVTIGELADEPFISYREGARLHELLMSAAGEASFQPKVMLESNENTRIRRMVSRGMGIALVPRSDAVGPGAEVAAIPLTAPRLTRDITLAWREDRRLPPAARAFLALTRETFPPLP
jgi:DNA-binding transcriptional LysR family regulator